MLLFMKNNIQTNCTADANKSALMSVITITTRQYIISIPTNVNQNVSFLRLMN